MDCGPAALKALFGGFGIYLSYGRLREACQTDVDGTSLDTLEEVAQKLGLDVAQTMMPADLILLKSSACLPAIVAVRLPDGAPHFVVLWNLIGPVAQIMDPAIGRIWVKRERLLQSLYIHQQVVPPATAEQWSRSRAFLTGVEDRLEALRLNADIWEDPIHQDASLRFAGTLARSGKLRRGEEAQEFLELCRNNRKQIPAEFWALREVESTTDEMQMQGAVLIAAAGGKKSAPEDVPESLAAVLKEPPPRVFRIVWSAIREDGWLSPALIGLVLIVIALGTSFEAVLFRCLLDLRPHLQLTGQRLFAIALVLVLLASLLVTELTSTLSLMRLGRHLEIRLRAAFLFKIPRLSDRYFQSRLISDMAFRAHTLQLIRQLPNIAGQLVRLAASLLWTGLGIMWLYPHAVRPAFFAISVALIVPIIFQPILKERDLRFREHNGSLGRFYLDVLLGARAIQAHCAQRAMRATHLSQLQQWTSAGLDKQLSLVHAEALQLTATLGFLTWIVYSEVSAARSPAGMLLLIYWCLAVPALGRQFASIAWSLPPIFNTLVRFLEPLGTPEEASHAPALLPKKTIGVQIEMEGLSVVTRGNPILENINLRIASGEHVAVVGPSGSGKSSLVGLLLGWNQPASGSMRVDGELLTSQRVAQLREEIVWIDPHVYLFQASLFDNLCYGNGEDAAARVDDSLENAGLLRLLRRVKDGMQTSLGESGRLLSGGEGQQVRIGRGLTRSDVRLVILDEGVRGLARDERLEFTCKIRRQFATATILCVTHDVSSALSFERVLVMEQGSIIEQGQPQELFEKSKSRFRDLCDCERSVGRHFWSNSAWRRLQMKDGKLTEISEGKAWTHV